MIINNNYQVNICGSLTCLKVNAVMLLLMKDNILKFFLLGVNAIIILNQYVLINY